MKNNVSTIIHLDFYCNWFRYPPDKYPVLALRGAPAAFPVAEKDVPLQKYIQWSDKIQDEIDHHIHKLFNNDPYVGIHLRNGADWVIICLYYWYINIRKFVSNDLV